MSTYYMSGSGREFVFHESHVKDPDTMRPVVVIDPEDEATVDRVADAIRDHHGRERNGVWAGIDWLATQAALRSLLTPPKPDEPTGLGAVVEDANGTKWIRHDSAPIHRRWINTDDCSERYATWDDLAAVRVLSEGVAA